MIRAMLRNHLIGLLALIGIAVLSISLVGLSGDEGGALTLHACFDDAGGLEAGAPVLVRGVRVGRVEGVYLDRDYRACAQLDVDADLELDRDTSAAIFTRSVLGDKYLAVEPGGSEVALQSGDEIHYTQSALVIERLIGRFVQGLGADPDPPTRSLR